MEATRIVSAVVKLWVLAMIGGALYFLWKDRAAPPLASQIEEAENITHTDVEVGIGTIKKMTLRGYVVGFGNVEASPATADRGAGMARVSVDWPAVVSEVKCVEGQHVEKGQTLFISKGASVISPIAGTVVLVDVHAGEIALPTQTAVEVVDLDRLVVAVGIPAWEAKAISAGQSASVEIPADSGNATGAKFDSKVERVDKAVDPKTNLVSVDIALPPGEASRPDVKLRLGEFARVSIVTRQQADCLVAPADAIVRDALDRPYVGVVSDDRKQAILKLVEPGLREGDWVQVSGDGIAADMAIVVSGAYALQYRNDIKVLNP
jgi:multidrug efflux pump subunit AcrA (membrane-fusion protein)